MRFSRLRLNGFKSFVDPTDLVISDGLTGVVGPNGCGKSNLLEALRWVMGENRPSAMRGSGMEDVIFAGAATRGARQFAEVSLMLDNSERLAPAGFNDADAMEISRRITRDSGSAYRFNGKEVRAKDIQMLFADASTGAHSPALVRQGQIAELINAKPRNRRRILEEAAGISGLYQRRHEAELRLGATEANLSRVDDVLEQLGQQLATLSRQARQAVRYRDLSAELRKIEGMLLFRRWHEADGQRAEALRQLSEAIHLAAEAEARAEAASELREGTEENLPGLREEEAIAAAVLQRALMQRDALADQESRAREALEGLHARIRQLQGDAEREAAHNRDAGDTLERLEWELDQLARAQEGEAEKLVELAAVAREAALVLAQAEGDLSEVTEDAARMSARHQSVQRALQDATASLERIRAELARAEVAAEVARGQMERAAAEHGEATELRDEALEQAEEAEAALADAEIARADAQGREAEARAARAAADGATGALRAELEALGRLVERDGAEGAGILDAIGVDAGFEAAFGAALADDLRAPLLDAEGTTGWLDLPEIAAGATLPAGSRPLADHVRAPAALSRRLSRIGIVEAHQGAAMQAGLLPGQRLVSLEGDLWRWDGFRAAGADAPSDAALRLQRINRLAQLEQDLAEAEAAAEAARATHDGLSQALAACSRAEAEAREARRQSEGRVSEASRALSRAEGERNLAQGRLDAALAARARFQDEAAEVEERLSEAHADAADLEDLAEMRGRVEEIRNQVELARNEMLARRAAHDEARREGEARTRRAQEVVKELTSWRQRQATAERHARDLAERRAAAEAELAEAEAFPAEIAERRETLAEDIAASEIRLATARARLQIAEGDLRAAQDSERLAERTAGEARELRARGEARAEAARETVQLAADRILEECNQQPADLLAELGVEAEWIPEVEHLDNEILRLRRSRDALGAVNLRAEEDVREVQSEHETLRTEKEDLEEAIRKLRSGITGLNREGRERLLAAFDQVNENFGTLFPHLFNGGEARLVLVESDDPLEAGLEIMCQPPGKKLATLSLLSGGEQTLTALALIFAVFLANPAPICVLDEVDAPLDDANVTRFCDLLDEMTRRTRTRFLVITHHAVTMARMDRLFGVTMQEQGVSQLVSVDLQRAEEMVA